MKLELQNWKKKLKKEVTPRSPKCHPQVGCFPRTITVR